MRVVPSRGRGIRAGDVVKGRELRAFLIERDGPRCRWCRRLTYDPVEVGELADCAATVEHLDTPRIRRHV